MLKEVVLYTTTKTEDTAKWKKADVKDETLYYSIYVNCPEHVNPEARAIDCW